MLSQLRGMFRRQETGHRLRRRASRRRTESLESRTLLAAIDWVNRADDGLDSDLGGFEETARQVDLVGLPAFDVVHHSRGRIDLADNEMFLLATGPDPREFRWNVPTNAAAADTTNTDQLQVGGLTGLGLTGAGYTVGVWEALDNGTASIRTTHVEFGNRVIDVDASGLAADGIPSDHATHVAGTIGASGVDPTARGMATQVNIRGRDAANDLAELANDANLIQVSNHSYGPFAGWSVMSSAAFGFTTTTGNVDVWNGDRFVSRLEDAFFGQYTDAAPALDQVLDDNPLLLSVWAAGNHRNETYSNASADRNYATFFSGDPGGIGWVGPGWYLVPNSGATAAPPGDGNAGTGFDSLGGAANAKNNLVVGAVRDITNDPYTSAQIVATTFSSFGPTDDGRVKPDVVANGDWLRSTGRLSDTDYLSLPGTSMAAPNVSGTAVLLIEHFNHQFGRAPTSAATKGVLIHTATDGGNVGPDYSFGWGLINATRAAEFITDTATGSAGYFSELIYSGVEQTIDLFSDGTEPLKATLVWTDTEGAAQAAGLDVTTSVLINDLNLWVTGPGGMYFPWTLDPANPASAAVRTSANTVDNVEQVLIDAPVPGMYTIHIGHAGEVADEDYALLVSGTGTELEIAGTPDDDDISINYSSGSQELEVVINGNYQVIAMSQGSVDSIRVLGLAGEDNIRIYRDPGVNSIEIDGGNENDTIVIGTDDGRFYELNANNIIIRGSEGHDTVLILDHASDSDERPYVLSGTAFTREGDQTVVALGAIEQFNVTTNARGTVMQIGDIPAGVTVSVSDSGGADLLIFGEVQGNQLGGSQGSFTYEKVIGATGGGSSAAFFHDEANPADSTYQISAAGTRSTLTRESASWSFRGISNFVLQTGEGSSTFEVFSSATDTFWVIDAGGGNDDLFVTPRRAVQGLPFPVGGNLTPHRANLSFAGGGGINSVTLDDRFSSSAREVTIGDSRADWVGSPGINLSSVQEISVLAGGLSDTFNLGGGNLFGEMRADVIINGGDGDDRINLFDENAAIPGGYLFGTQVAGYGVVEAHFQKWYAVDLGFPFVYRSGELNVRGVERLDLQGSALDDVFEVAGTPAGLTYNLFGNDGADEFRIDGHALRSGINVFGGPPTAPTFPGDTLVVNGTREDTGSYLPGSSTSNGRVSANGHNIEFSGLEPVYVEGFGSFGFITPRSRDIIDIRRYPERALPGTPVWTEISGTSGVVNTGFEALRVRDIGTLTGNFYVNDLIPELPFNIFDPTDVVTIHPGALSGNRVDRLQLMMGIGNDRLIDQTLEGSRATTVLAPIYVTPTVHRISGTAARIEMGSLRAFDAEGTLIHDVHSSGPGRIILEESQPLVTFEQSNVTIELDAGTDGRQLLRSSHSLSTWEFETSEFRATTEGDSTVAIIAILNIAPVLLGGPGPDTVSIIAPMFRVADLQIRGFDAQDTIRFSTLSSPGQSHFFGADFSDPSHATVNLITDPRVSATDPRDIPDLSLPFAGVVGEIVRTQSGELPAVEMIGDPTASQNIALVTAPASSSSLPTLAEINLTAIELLVFIGPEAFVQPGADGPVVNDRDNVRVTSDSSLGVVIPDTLSRPGDLGRVDVGVRATSMSRTIINPYAIELLVYEGPGELMTFDHMIHRTYDAASSRFSTTERVIAGDWTIERNLYNDPLNTTLSASVTNTGISQPGDGEYPQDLDILHRLTGSTSAFDVQGRFRGRVGLSVEGAEGAENLIAASIRNTAFTGGFSLDIDGPSSGSTTVFLGESGVSYGPSWYRSVNIAAGGGETLLFQGSSNVRTDLDNRLITNLQLEGGLATVLSAAGNGTSPADLYSDITSLRTLDDPTAASFERTLDLLRTQLSVVGATPAGGSDAPRSVNLTGAGALNVIAFDETTAGTNILANTSGELLTFTEGNVTIGIPALVGTGIDVDGPLHISTVLNTSDFGPGSLREAFESAFAAPANALAVVTFAIPPTDSNFVDVDSHLPGGDAEPDAFVISPLTALPANFRGHVVINGQSQQNLSGDTNPFGPEIVLSGTLAGAGVDGLVLGSLENRIHALNIQGFGGDGVSIAGNGNVVTASYIGTDASGTSASQSIGGLLSLWSAEGNADDSTGNNHGTLVNGISFAPGRSGQAFQFDGVNDSVATPLVVDYTAGVTFELWVSTLGDGGNTLMAGGGGATADRGMGLFLESGRPALGGTKNTPGSPNFVIHPNISITDGQFHHIVATWTGDTSANGVKLYLDGQLVGAATAATSIATDGTPLYLGDHPNYYLPFRGLIDEPAVYGRVLSESEVAARFLTEWRSTANGGSGVLVNSGRDNVVGGTIASNRNVISGNAQHGVHIIGNSFPEVPPVLTDNPDQLIRRGNTVIGNYVGTTADGLQRLGNSQAGVYVENSALNVVGGMSTGARNVLSGNQTGVWIFGAQSSDNQVGGNFIGLAADGETAAGNSAHGVLVSGLGNSLGGGGNLIGGMDPSLRNVISANGQNNISLASTGTIVQGNLIGTDQSGTRLPVGIGGGRVGIRVNDDVDSLLGGAEPGAGNVIVGQNWGIYLSGRYRAGGAEGTIIQGNSIGVLADGHQKLANNWGVYVDGFVDTNGLTRGVTDVLVGGAEPNAGNTVSGNAQQGIVVYGPGAQGIRIQGNSIGTSVDGNTAVPNGPVSTVNGAGIVVTDTSGVMIGGTESGQRNVIAGNNGSGISITGGSNHVMQGNYIGTTVDGNSPLLNRGSLSAGVKILNSSGNFIGGTETGARNVIGGSAANIDIRGAGSINNAIQGNFIGIGADGINAIQQSTSERAILISDGASNTDIGGFADGAGNVISGHSGNSIEIFGGGGGNLIAGNRIGTTAAGDARVGNVASYANLTGIRAVGSPDTQIVDNLISGNANGIRAEGASSGLAIRGNRIGTNLAGNAKVSNQFYGIVVDGVVGTVIGGYTAEDMNLISGNGSGVFLANGSEHLLVGNRIGTDVSGTEPLGNTNHGIYVSGADDVVIGGSEPGAGNLLSGNTWGIQVLGGASGVKIQANRIGTGREDTVSIPNAIGVSLRAPGNFLGTDGDGMDDALEGNLIHGNTSVGVEVSQAGTERNVVAGNRILSNSRGISIAAGAANNRIGTNADGTSDVEERNVISGSVNYGIVMENSSGSTIAGNYLGVDATGQTAMGNHTAIYIGKSSNNVVGGAGPGAGNVISGNRGTAVYVVETPATANVIQNNLIGTTADGAAALGNVQGGVYIVGASNTMVDGNVIAGSGAAGVWIQGVTATGNVVRSNSIGTNADGTADFGNAEDGVTIAYGVSGALVSDNVISANRRHGVTIVSSSENTVLNNRIGTTGDGLSALGNAANGIMLSGTATGNQIIGGVVSANALYGIRFQDATTTGNVVRGVNVGTDIAGSSALGNGYAGVLIWYSPENVLEANLISGNGTEGVLIQGTTATGNVLRGNQIGTTEGGAAGLGNGRDGVALSGSATATTVVANVISGNHGSGIAITGGSDHVIQRNAIGTDASGTWELANSGDGVRILNASRVLIGTDGDGIDDTLEGNVVASNGGHGVSVIGDLSVENTIRGNPIHSNGGLAIDLAADGVTVNDYGDLLAVPPIPPDTDSGPNLRQNYPEIRSGRKAASGRNAGVSVNGGLTSTPETTFIIDVYRNATSAREGRDWIGSVEVTTNRDGSVRFSATFDVTAADVGEYLTATATQVVARTAGGKVSGNTSEFSEPRQVTGSGKGGGDFALAGSSATSDSDGRFATELSAAGRGAFFDHTDDLFSQPSDWMWSED